MMSFEIINPSDEVWLRANDARIAIAATIILGDGFYGLKDEHAETVMGAIALGDHEGFLTDKFGSPADYSRFVQEHLSDIAECLESCELKRERTSMNDIVGKAEFLSKQLRKVVRERSPDPQSAPGFPP